MYLINHHHYPWPHQAEYIEAHQWAAHEAALRGCREAGNIHHHDHQDPTLFIIIIIIIITLKTTILVADDHHHRQVSLSTPTSSKGISLSSRFPSNHHHMFSPESYFGESQLRTLKITITIIANRVSIIMPNMHSTKNR